MRLPSFSAKIAISISKTFHIIIVRNCEGRQVCSYTSAKCKIAIMMKKSNFEFSFDYLHVTTVEDVQTSYKE